MCSTTRVWTSTWADPAEIPGPARFFVSTRGATASTHRLSRRPAVERGPSPTCDGRRWRDGSPAPLGTEHGTEPSHTRHGSLASVTSGCGECPWGRLGAFARRAHRGLRGAVTRIARSGLRSLAWPMAIEVIGDSARGDAYAAARLVVDGERIVEADAPGMERPLAGLTLLEAAAVPGETLAADARCQRDRAGVPRGPRAGRIAVAMSGGVDSAVSLHRAGANAVGVTLRLWLDPNGPTAERACCSPDAVIGARETCHALGIPHVTLDLREAFRDAVVRMFVDGYAAGLTPNPCMRCNGGFRFAALVAFRRACRRRRVVDRPLRSTGRARRHAPRRAWHRRAQGPVVHARDRRSGTSRACRLPARRADQGGGARRGGSRGPRRGAPAREPGSLLSRRWRLPVVPRAATASSRSPATSWTSDGAILGRHDGLWRFTPGQRRGLGIASPSRSSRCAPTRRRTRSSSARDARSEHEGLSHAAGCTCRSSAPRRSSGTGLLRSCRGHPDGRGIRVGARSSRSRRSRPGRSRSSTTRTSLSERA